MKIGDIELLPVTDGTVWNDGGGAFGLVPKTTWEKLLPCDSCNRIPMVLRCIVIRTPQATILVETGMGDKVTPEMAALNNVHLSRPDGWLLDSLATQGISPNDVDIVLLTHLHSDHSGGSTRIIDGELVPTFPRAQYWVQEREWEDAHHLNERTRGTYFGFNYDPLEQAKQLRLLNGDASVTQGVRLVTAPGHTRGLQIVTIESGGQTAVFLGDAAFFHWQIEKLAWVSAYDIDPNTNIETKRIWQKWLAERQALILFQHDPMIIAGKLIVESNRYKVEAVLQA
ncbi:MAG: MBL fold metallo-hydrolase [Deltaproteobacteria bacterium]|nr:MBL fold metallo-hydrolase [Deltaproteobacteria bacterium]